MSLRALRWLFAVYVLLLCALAISDPSLERGGALFVLAVGLTILVWDIDRGVVDEQDDNDPRESSNAYEPEGDD